MTPIFRVFDRQRSEYLSEGRVLLEIPASKRDEPKTVVYLDELSLPDRYRDRFEFEQWLGCLDSAGTRIFLGDVLRDSTGNHGAIIWNQDDASFCVLFPGFDCQPIENVDEWGTVVSTVHDRDYKDLLKGERD